MVNYGKTVEGLRALMADHQLTQRDVAELACVSVKTVESWLADPGAAHFRKMPPRHLLAIAHQLPGFLGKRKTAAKAARKAKK
jgi:transcriptional regulator with XRE-family HTH domain